MKTKDKRPSHVMLKYLHQIHEGNLVINGDFCRGIKGLIAGGLIRDFGPVEFELTEKGIEALKIKWNPDYDPATDERRNPGTPSEPWGGYSAEKLHAEGKLLDANGHLIFPQVIRDIYKNTLSGRPPNETIEAYLLDVYCIQNEFSLPHEGVRRDLRAERFVEAAGLNIYRDKINWIEFKEMACKADGKLKIIQAEICPCCQYEVRLHQFDRRRMPEKLRVLCDGSRVRRVSVHNG